MNKEKRKLIFAWNYLEWGGAQIYFLGIMKLARVQWDITVVLPEGSDPKLLKFIDDLGVRYEFVKGRFDLAPADSVGRKVTRRFNILLSEVNVFRHLLKFDLSGAILHIEAAPWQSAGLLLALAARGANIFVTMHNALPDASVWREFIWKLKIGVVSRLRKFRLFASNQDTKNRFRRWVSESFFDTIKVTYTTVNPAEIDSVRAQEGNRETVRQRLGIPAEKFVVLCLGQFIDRKGRWLFLDAAKSLRAAHPNIQFVWITSSVISSSDRERIAAYDIDDSFRLVDADAVGKERREILAAYSAADIYALPSYVEGLPVALLESMAMGVPSVSTDVYAIPEAIKHEETGILIEPGSAEQLADAVVRLHNDQELRDRLGKHGREFVIANFDERVASQIAVDEYMKALA
ncbi:MAG: glycosyltransferase family 4 protein [Pyrinomonadaceae bacterium]|nr:glycosyltransferase family 4 protein [Pyrinomonadaceae bacterium]MBP9109041.1 glycosyltransferase family 4 protein [Pyrinomonadaceae bacterium]